MRKYTNFPLGVLLGVDFFGGSPMYFYLWFSILYHIFFWKRSVLGKAQFSKRILPSRE